jgi:hypothetical protein
MRAEHIIGDFEGAKTFLTPKLSLAQRRAILGSLHRKMKMRAV